MKIIYIGNYRPEWSTENHIAYSLEDLGHIVFRMQEDETELAHILEIQNDYDFILYTRTWDNCKGDRDYFLKNKKIPLVGFSLDIWIGLSRQPEVEKQLMFKSDYLFTADGGHQKEFKKMGINHIWLRPGIWDRECRFGMKQAEFETKDVCFVGSYNYHHEHPFRKDLIDWLQYHYGAQFALYGSSGEIIRGLRLNDLYTTVPIVVGDSFDSPYYWSDRLYETLGRGGFLLHPKTIGLDEELQDGVHYVAYERENWADLQRKIEFYKTHYYEREKIRLAGFEKVRDNYTYKHRMQTLIKFMENVCKKKKSLKKPKRKAATKISGLRKRKSTTAGGNVKKDGRQ